jgi:glycosyltransferase involved in cell wall biosynthesis
MRVGLLIYGDMNSLSGGYLYNRKLVAYLQDHGEQVEIISLPQQRYWRHLTDNFRRSLIRRIAAARLDILIQDELAHPSLFYLNRHLDVPVVALIHLLSSFDNRPWYSAWLYRRVETRYLRSVRGLIANSQTTLEQTRTLLDDRLPPYCVAVPAGDRFADTAPDDQPLSGRNLSQPGPLRILAVGNVIRRKGLHVLLRALAELPARDFQVSVAGRLDMEPGYVRQIKKQIETAQLQDRVSLLGPQADQALAALYRRHHLMVLPSSYESYGIVYVEAQQFGLPVIGTTFGAAREIIRPGWNGYLIEPEDSRQLAGLLKTLHSDRRLLSELSRNALTAFSHHPGWDASCRNIRDFLYASLNRAVPEN